MQTADTTELTDNIYFAGCSRGCYFCFNKEMTSHTAGNKMTWEGIIKHIKNSPSKWVALMGGEPMEQPTNELYTLIEEIHKIGKKVIMFTSYSPLQLILPNVDKYHVDIKYFAIDTDYTPIEDKDKRFSFGFVCVEIDYNTFIEIVGQVKDYPMYLKTPLQNSSDENTRLYKRWLLEQGFTQLYIDEKVKLK